MNARDYTDDSDFSQGKGDPDMSPGGRWIGVDMSRTEITIEGQPHWSELPPPVGRKKEWELGDKMADGSDDQEYEEKSNADN